MDRQNVEAAPPLAWRASFPGRFLLKGPSVAPLDILRRIVETSLARWPELWNGRCRSPELDVMNVDSRVASHEESEPSIKDWLPTMVSYGTNRILIVVNRHTYQRLRYYDQS
jgi:hypothetical protein